MLSKLIKMRVFKQKELLFSMSDTEPLLRTSYNQQEAGTNERGAKRAAEQQQVDLLAAICSQTRSRPREQATSKWVESCRRPGSLAWFVWRRRPNEKRRRQANSACRRPKKIRDLLRSPFSSRSVVARAALTEQRLRPPLVVHKADRRERAQKLLVQNKRESVA